MLQAGGGRGGGGGLPREAAAPGQLQDLAQLWDARRNPDPHSCLPVPAFIPLPCSFLSPLAGGPELGFLCFFFLSSLTRINQLSVDCETVLETKSDKSCGFFYSHLHLPGYLFAACSELAPLARTELNPNWSMLEAGMETWGALPPPRHDAVFTCLAKSVIGKEKRVDGRREMYSKENQLVLLNYD